MKTQPKKARETRTAYRVRTRTGVRTSKPRATKSQARKAAAPVVRLVPWEERIAPTDEQLVEWDAWLNAREVEFEEKYPGHYLAIWDRQVIAVAATRAQLYALADQIKPEVIPLVTYIPRAEDMFIVPSNFPAEWIEEARPRIDHQSVIESFGRN